MTTDPNEASALLIADLPLDNTLLQAAAQLEFSVATEVQALAIPAILEEKDVLVSAATGSGKTAAFLLPTLHRLLREESDDIGALILAPTRELAQQIADVCRQLLQFTSLTVGLITGGDDFKKQQQCLRKNTDIIIATPGRLVEHLKTFPDGFANLQVLILDEADRMLDMGFSKDVLAIADSCSTQRQTLMFSATLKHPAVTSVASSLLRDPVMFTLNTLQDRPEDIEQQIIPCDDHAHKQQVLFWLLLHEAYDKAIIFTNTKVQAEQLRGPLRGQKLRTQVLHGDMDQTERNRVMEMFREGSVNVLVTTDVAGRGLDIPGIELVINYDMPRNGHQYVHRIGRTGRNNASGVAISLVFAYEWNLMSGIERYLKQNFLRRMLAEVPSHFKGPKKLKSSGKAKGAKPSAPPKKEVVKKPKQRHRDTKNVGKRRQSAASNTSNETDN